MGIELDGERLRTRAASAKNEKLRLATTTGLGTEVGTRHGACDLHISGASASLIRFCGGVQIPAGAL